MSDTAKIFQLPLEELSKSKRKSKGTVLDDLISINKHHQIKLRLRKLLDGSFHLYLDYWRGKKHSYQFLKIFIDQKRWSRKKNEENFKLAISVRDKKELELFQNSHDFQLRNRALNGNFIDYFDYLVTKRARPDKSWNHTLKHLKLFAGESLLFRRVDQKFCGEFKDYLVKTLAPNTAHVYFSKFKAALNRAVREGILNQNPAQSFHIQKVETKRQFLTEDELITLKKTGCRSEETKNAFLFATQTGLRISDLKKLTFNDIQNGYLHFRQQKTKGVSRIKLSPTAHDIIRRQKKKERDSELVFELISDIHTNKHIKKWVKKAKINKSVSWHVARHSFAYLALKYNENVYVVSKLLGHRDLKTTEIYVRLFDKQADLAVDRLPKI
jgi:integrase